MSDPETTTSAPRIPGEEATVASSTQDDDELKSPAGKSKIKIAALFFVVIGGILGLYFGLRDPNTDFKLAGRPIKEKDNGFGNSVDISNDGNTLVASAPGETDQIYAYDWNGSKWKQVGDAIPTACKHSYVAISGNGQRIVAGSFEASSCPVQTFQRVGDEFRQIWFNSNIHPKGFVSSLDISEDGNRVALGVRTHDEETLDPFYMAQVFDWNGTAWEQVGMNLEVEQATTWIPDVELSADGNRMAVAFSSDDDYTVQVFDWVETEWAQIGLSFVGLAEVVASATIALSSDGSRLAIGDLTESRVSRVRVFEWSGDAWTQIGNEMTDEDHVRGYYVDMSADGNRVIARTNRAHDKYPVRIFDWTGTDWEQYHDGIKIQKYDNRDHTFGSGVAASANGMRIAIAGSPIKAWGDCKVWVYDQAES